MEINVSCIKTNHREVVSLVVRESYISLSSEGSSLLLCKSFNKKTVQNAVDLFNSSQLRPAYAVQFVSHVK